MEREAVVAFCVKRRELDQHVFRTRKCLWRITHASAVSGLSSQRVGGEQRFELGLHGGRGLARIRNGTQQLQERTRLGRLVHRDNRDDLIFFWTDAVEFVDEHFVRRHITTIVITSRYRNHCTLHGVDKTCQVLCHAYR